MKSLISFFILLAGNHVFAAPGIQEASQPNFKDPYTLAGLCTGSQGNDKLYYMQSSYCMTIYETLNNLPCVAEKVEELRLRFLNDEEKMAKAKFKNKGEVSLGFSCDSENRGEGENIEEAAKSKEKFNMILMNLFSAIAAEQSQWKSSQGGSNEKVNQIRCTNDCGLLGLNLNEMKKDKYACGCKIANKTDNQEQMDAGMDAHLNLRCGITMAITEALEVPKDAEDKQDHFNNFLGGGNPKHRDRQGEVVEESRTGMAKIFKVLEEKERPEGAKRPATARERIEEKMETYCKIDAYNKGATQKTLGLVQEKEGLNAIGMPKSDTGGRSGNATK